MRRRGKGPRDVYVRRYPRWKRGKRERVGEGRRGQDHKLSHRKTAKQMDFGF